MQPELFKPGAQFKRSAEGKDPTRTPIYCHYGDERFHMLDIPPWGMVLSVELGEVAFVQYFFEIHSQGLPAGTVLGMRWKPEDGKNPHTTTYRMTGQELENVKLRLENPWILESEGKHVVIEHEIVLPDGTVQIGEPFELGITKRLHWRGMIVGNDLQDRDDLDPSEYPNGLVVHFQPIDNLEGWHPVIQSWSVMAYTDEGYVGLGYLNQELSPTPGASYDFLIPPRMYTDFEQLPYDWIGVQCTAGTRTSPSPNPQHNLGFGGIDLWLKRPAGK